MSTLTGKKIKDTYDGLLKTSDNLPLTNTLKDVQDGTGQNSGIKINNLGELQTSGDVKILKSTNVRLNIARENGADIEIKSIQGSGYIGTVNDKPFDLKQNGNVIIRLDTDGTNAIKGDTGINGDVTATNLSGTNTGDQDLTGSLKTTGNVALTELTVIQDGLGNDSALELGLTGQGAKITNKFIVENTTDDTKFTRIDEFGIQLGRNSSRIVPDGTNHTLEIGQDNKSWGKVKMDASTFEIKSGNDSVLQINQAGNVGISTLPNNESKLHVKGNISIEEGTYNGIDTGARVAFSKKDGTKVGGIGFDKVQLDGTVQQMYISAKNDIISTPDYEAIRIDSENNLGVKVSGSNLQATLDVGGAIKIGSENVTVNGYVRGMLRYRELTDRSIVEMCMKIANNGAASDYAFITIQENIW